MKFLKSLVFASSLALSLTGFATTISCTGLNGEADKIIHVSPNAPEKIGMNGDKQILLSDFGPNKLLVVSSNSKNVTTMVIDFIEGFSIRSPGYTTLDCVRLNN